jgi:ribonuclease R
MFRAYLMREQLGEQLSGTVSGVTSFGAFVEVDEPFVEGLVRIDALGEDHFDHDPVRMQLSGRTSGTTLSLGDRVLVEVVRASVPLRRVDFRLLDVASHTSPRKRDKSRGKAKTRGGADAERKAGARTRTARTRTKTGTRTEASTKTGAKSRTKTGPRARKR